METCKVVKDGKKWVVILEDGSVAFTGKTRVSCFRFAQENGLKITQIQHGGE